ncbi:hypothetical protein CEP52_006632 [Fusarium oligoseptatum]|uniref:Uncharacterized protein n=1 Tax=Fusarium oligoseptatum TaxID=2604345 RepID=A0A428TRR3_9HYPO|nr:hypothetical protein CEP52_006632 [Fusarium oligoseptatum]
MEARKIIEGVQGIYGGQMTHGTLRLTDFHLVFCAPIDQSQAADPAASSSSQKAFWGPSQSSREMDYIPDALLLHLPARSSWVSASPIDPHSMPRLHICDLQLC